MYSTFQLLVCVWVVDRDNVTVIVVLSVTFIYGMYVCVTV